MSLAETVYSLYTILVRMRRFLHSNFMAFPRSGKRGGE
jgi:hypothetical protein